MAVGVQKGGHHKGPLQIHLFRTGGVPKLLLFPHGTDDPVLRKERAAADRALLRIQHPSVIKQTFFSHPRILLFSQYPAKALFLFPRAGSEEAF